MPIARVATVASQTPDIASLNSPKQSSLEAAQVMRNVKDYDFLVLKAELEAMKVTNWLSASL